MKRKGALKKLFQYVKREIAPLMICLMLSIASVLLAVFATTVLRTLVNLIDGAARATSDAFLSIREVLDFKEVCRLCFWLVGMYAGSVICAFFQSFLMTGIVQRVSYRLRKDLSQKINLLPLNYFDTHKTGDVMSCVTNDVDTVAQSLSAAVSTTVSAVVQIILVAAIMFVTKNRKLTQSYFDPEAAYTTPQRTQKEKQLKARRIRRSEGHHGSFLSAQL